MGSRPKTCPVGVDQLGGHPVIFDVPVETSTDGKNSISPWHAFFLVR
jgi:hypothetical protein